MPKESKKIRIYYFSGTGNSRYAAFKAAKQFRLKKYSVDVKDIAKPDAVKKHSKFDIFGFFAPVYAGGIPPIMINFIKQMPKGNGKKGFIFLTYGTITVKNKIKYGGPGNAIMSGLHILKSCGYKSMGGNACGMPSNVFDVLEKKHMKTVFNTADKSIKKFINIISAGKIYIKKVSFISRIINACFYYFFSFGYNKMAKTFFTVSDLCNGCGICARVCPVNNIKMANQKKRSGSSGKKPQFSLNCESCMRCINYCPNQAISAAIFTNGKIFYHEPSQKLKDVIMRK